MKTFVAVAFTAATLLTIAGQAQARPHHHAHRECYMRHHHRVCHWVR